MQDHTVRRPVNTLPPTGRMSPFPVSCPADQAASLLPPAPIVLLRATKGRFARQAVGTGGGAESRAAWHRCPGSSSPGPSMTVDVSRSAEV